MTYSPTIPGPTDLLSQSQADILTNFDQANLIMGVNHVNFDNSLPAGAVPANRGKHNFVTLLKKAADPATTNDEIAIYSKDVGAGVIREFLRQQNNGAVIQTSGPNPVIAVPGQTYLPGGIIIKWGRDIIAATPVVTQINFAAAFPNNCYAVFLTPLSAVPNYVSVTFKDQTNFKAIASIVAPVFWLAIGA